MASPAIQMKNEKDFPSGNRTPVTRVTGGYTNHYTNEKAVV
jgi:hypothetical protein